ncbi:MAG: hypothetical protein RLO50_13825 [Azospirillaceae bacterium]
MRRGAFVMALALGLLGSAAYAKDGAPARLTGAPGSYAFVLGDEGDVLTAAYWIDAETVIVFPPGSAPIIEPSITQLFMADRGFLPTRLIAGVVLLNRAFDYAAPPVPGPDGGTTEIAVREFSFDLDGAPRTDRAEDYTITLHWLPAETRRLGATELTLWPYRGTNLTRLGRVGMRREDGAVERVYLPAFDLDLDAETWTDAASIHWGDGMTASADLGFEVALASAAGTPLGDCLEGIRGEPAYAVFLAGFAALEQRSIPLLRRGTTDAMEFGLAEYIDLERRYAVARRFRQCHGM